MTNITYNCDICGKKIGMNHSEIRFDGGSLDFLGRELELCSHCFRKLMRAINETVDDMKHENRNMD